MGNLIFERAWIVGVFPNSPAHLLAMAAGKGKGLGSVRSRGFKGSKTFAARMARPTMVADIKYGVQQLKAKGLLAKDESSVEDVSVLEYSAPPDKTSDESSSSTPERSTFTSSSPSSTFTSSSSSSSGMIFWQIRGNRFSKRSPWPRGILNLNSVSEKLNL